MRTKYDLAVYVKQRPPYVGYYAFPLGAMDTMDAETFALLDEGEFKFAAVLPRGMLVDQVVAQPGKKVACVIAGQPVLTAEWAIT